MAHSEWRDLPKPRKILWMKQTKRQIKFAGRRRNNGLVTGGFKTRTNLVKDENG